MKELWDLYKIFFRMGAFTFGGGYAMLPIIQKEIVETRRWASEEEVLDIYAIGQVTPGIIAVNTASFIGYKRRGVAGSIFSTLGMITPSLIIITIIAAFFSHFQDYEIVRHAFAGIRAAVGALILVAVMRMWNKSVIDKTSLLIFGCGFFFSAFFNISPMIIVIVSAAAGILIGQFSKGKVENPK